MSHIGKKPINIPEGVEININDDGKVNVISGIFYCFKLLYLLFDLNLNSW